MSKRRIAARVFGTAAAITLLCSPVFGSAEMSNDREVTGNHVFNVRSPEILGRGTHTVLGEYVTATWCGYCKYAHGALMEIDDEAQYDFVYVVHVTDKCSWAVQRKNEFHTYGYPTVYFDGGDEVVVGAGSVPSAKAAYIAAINTCGARTVPSLTVEQQVVWLGNATMEIRVRITNNDASTYEGFLRTFVTETSSSLGWNDTWNIPYTYAFLDYAVKEPDLVIAPGETVIFSNTWDGNTHQNGYGVYYGNITQDNITVVSGVYNDEWHQGYSYPPNQYPFDAYYVDQADKAEPWSQGDANGDGLVDIDDVFAVLAGWGPCGVCPADVNQDGVVDIDDVFFVLANWT